MRDYNSYKIERVLREYNWESIIHIKTNSNFTEILKMMWENFWYIKLWGLKPLPMGKTVIGLLKDKLGGEIMKG